MKQIVLLYEDEKANWFEPVKNYLSTRVKVHEIKNICDKDLRLEQPNETKIIFVKGVRR